MAIWQVDFNIIEKNREIDDDILLWKRDVSEKAKQISFLEDNSWCEGVVQFGKSDLTCIELCMDDSGEHVEEISVRIDIREPDRKLIENILRYINELDAVIFYDGKIYSPDNTSMMEILRNSRAYKFCESPYEYLENLAYESRRSDSVSKKVNMA